MSEEQTISEELNKYWNAYLRKQTKEIIEKDKEEIEKIIIEWGEYKNKINNKKFELTDYTNLKTPQNDYLCHFLERKTTIIGSSRPGNSGQYGVYRITPQSEGNKDNELYRTYDDETSKEDKKNDKNALEANDEKIKKQFAEILELLKKIVTSDDIDVKIEKIEEKNEKDKTIISAKQVLMKLMVLEHPNKFIQIYQKGSINNLYDKYCPFKNSEENQSQKTEQNKTEKDNKDLTILDKNLAIAEWAKSLTFETNTELTNILEKTDANTELKNLLKNLLKMRYRSAFLWEISQELDLFDGDNKNIILYGAPGTGKTYMIEDFKYQQSLRGNICQTVQFHPSYSYEDFIDGIKPCGIEDKQMQFELVNGHFKDFCIKAKKDYDNAQDKTKAKKHYFIIDEINRANLSAVFGELMYCLEYRYKGEGEKGLVSTQNAKIIENLIKNKSPEEKKESELVFELDKKNEVKFGIPDNVYIIGMMNDVDRSIDAFDLALRRRFKWKRMPCDYDVLSENLTDYENIGYSKDKTSNSDSYIGACRALNDYISIDLNLGKSYEFGHSFFLKIGNTRKNNTKKITQAMLNSLFTDYLESTLKEYLRANFSEKELDDKLKKAKNKFKL